MAGYVQRDPAGYKDGLNVYTSVHNNPVNAVDPLGLESVRDQSAALLARLNDLQARKDFDYQANGGKAGANSAYLWKEIQGTKAQVVALGKASTWEVATAAGEGALQGARTGAKAVANAAIDTTASTLTLGYVDKMNVIGVSELDREIGYDAAYGVARTGTELIGGVATGSLACKAGMIGRVARGYDLAGNVTTFAEGTADAAENGLSVGNVFQMASGAAGTIGNFAPESCFVAGTPVLSGDGSLAPIEAVRVGDRLATDGGLSNNEAVAGDPDATAVRADWKLLTIDAARLLPDGTRDVWRVQTLQPPEWVKLHRADAGGLLALKDVLDLAEMGLPDGLVGRVDSVAPAPTIAGGRGRVVLTTVNHLNDYVFDLTLSDGAGDVDTFGVTGFHKFFSEDRDGWMSAAELQAGEELRGHDGPVRVLDVSRVAGTERVYNFTVEADHVYFAGDFSTLTHNNGCNLNRNDAVSNFGIDEIRVSDQLHKIGKADLNRITQSSGLPTRLHQQVRKLGKEFGEENVVGRVVEDLGSVTTAKAKTAETARIRNVYESTRVVPKGNERSFRP